MLKNSDISSQHRKPNKNSLGGMRFLLITYLSYLGISMVEEFNQLR